MRNYTKELINKIKHRRQNLEAQLQMEEEERRRITRRLAAIEIQVKNQLRQL